ncbi:hypothetical protein LTR70_005098 [Exophiala xenobiotica]|nr:hypothetical protein LTR70_005098 [Exophiala xenobiotica]
MLASALPQLVRSQAAGTHYSVADVALPYTPGIDGVGYTDDGKLVYVNLLAGSRARGGGFAEWAVVDERAVTEVRAPGSVVTAAGDGDGDGASEGDEEERMRKREVGVKVAALVNPALSSWMAMKYRANISEFESRGKSWSVLVLGATSASGRIAALFARRLGAARVIGAARDSTALERLRSRGVVDESIVLDRDNVSKTDWSALRRVEIYPLVVLDYVYGRAALALMDALPGAASMAEELEVRWVQVGALGGESEIVVPGPLLRGKNLSLSGAGPGSWSMKALGGEMGGLIGAIVEGVGLEGEWREEYGVVERRLEDVGEAWADREGRTVFVEG